MNELIERLARESGMLYGCLVKAPTVDDLEVFAKAVARECSEIARTTENPFSVSRVIRERFEL